MSVEIKVYTIEQQTRLTQFQRARGLVSFLREKEDDLRRGIVVITPAENGVSRGVDFTEYKIFKGALSKMFDRVMDLGLQEEITN